MYYLGIDAGGTYTRFVMMDSQGSIVDRLKSDSIHFMKVGFDGITTGLYAAKSHFEDKGFDFNEIKIAIGMGGFGEAKEIQTKIKKAIDKVFTDYIIMNDAKFAMISALNNQDGVYVISGTGSIAFQTENNVDRRKGGFGYLLGDEGSAFWIGKRILTLFTQEADGRVDKSDLYSLIMDEFKLDSPYDLIQIANDHHDYRGWVASISGLTSNISNSPQLINIYKDAGKELADLANSFNIKESTQIAVGGGVLLNNEIVFESFKKHLDPLYRIVSHSNPVEYAAYLLLGEE